MNNVNTFGIFLILVSMSLVSGGCFHVKTESEIKPIHITMDINLKVDKELDKAFADENTRNKQPPANSQFAEVKAAMERGAVGVTNLALLTPREGASGDDKILVAESNARRMKRFEEVAKNSGVGVEAVQKRQYRKMMEAIPAGSGVWYQNEDGSWAKK